MTTGSSSPAVLPPPGLDGLQADWSRLVVTPGLDGVGRTWHVLDNQVADPTVTLLCVHGNPTWSYLWRRSDRHGASPPCGSWRWTSSTWAIPSGREPSAACTTYCRSGRPHRRARPARVRWSRLPTIGAVPISLGWAQQHKDEIAGIVLMNTAVHQPAAAPAPRLIRLVRTAGILEKACVATPAFVRGATALSRPRIARPIREAYQAPYRTAGRRLAVGAFVEDIPLSDDHPSRRALDQVADGLATSRASDLAVVGDPPTRSSPISTSTTWPSGCPS